MKTIPLNKFITKYSNVIKDALRRNEEILITSKGIPYFIVTPVRPKIDYQPVDREGLRENPQTFVRVTKKFKGKKVRSELFLIG